MTSTNMSKTERQTLIRLVKQRFKLLETGLAARRQQLQTTIREQIQEENKAESLKWKERMDTEVMDALHALVRKGEDLIKEARDAGFERHGYGWHNLASALSNTANNTGFSPADLEKQVQQRMEAVIGGKHLGRYALELEESRLVEELLVGDLKGDDAKEFLSQVPTLDSLIPLPAAASQKAIDAAELDISFQRARRR